MPAVAFFDLDSSQLVGAIQPEDGGWIWNLTADFSDTAQQLKLVGIPVVAHTLDGDGLPAIETKLTSAVKAAGVGRGITVTSVVYSPFKVVAV